MGRASRPVLARADILVDGPYRGVGQRRRALTATLRSATVRPASAAPPSPFPLSFGPTRRVLLRHSLPCLPCHGTKLRAPPSSCPPPAPSPPPPEPPGACNGLPSGTAHTVKRKSGQRPVQYILPALRCRANPTAAAHFVQCPQTYIQGCMGPSSQSTEEHTTLNEEQEEK